MAKVKKPKPVIVKRRFSDCPESVYDLLRTTRREKFPVLDGVTITCNFAFAATKDDIPTGPDLKLHGVPCGAIISITPLAARVSGHDDAIIRISHQWWEDHPSDADRIGLLAHELRHLIYTGETDTHGRPKLKSRPHDFDCSGFYDGIEAEQQSCPEFQHLVAINKELRERNLIQQEFWG